MDGEEALKSLIGWKFDSPRGPIMIDPETRDIVMNEYLDEVVKGTDGKLHQKVIGKIDNVKDPCKELKIGPCAPKNDGARRPQSVAAVCRPIAPHSPWRRQWPNRD